MVPFGMFMPSAWCWLNSLILTLWVLFGREHCGMCVSHAGVIDLFVSKNSAIRYRRFSSQMNAFTTVS